MSDPTNEQPLETESQQAEPSPTETEESEPETVTESESTETAEEAAPADSEPSAETEPTDDAADAATEAAADPEESAETGAENAEDEPPAEAAGPKKKTTKRTSKKKAPVKSAAQPETSGGTRRMLINYVPGEECRVAIVEQNALEEYYAERTASANRVGNIYLGRVSNVEPAIQAAFVDFGAEENAFLHVTDLHPRFFPKESAETTERIGKKTSRAARPPIQQCLKRGQQILVQVLKDGVGTKGPAVTSYLSIPGRYLVMMPNMDKVGVSRKVEDEDTRKKMKKQLDQLDLPEGFGFILRTAGLDKNKTELKRDLSYLQRLWKDMEKRQKKASKPTLLYAESDLLVRSLRDILTAEIDEIVIDDLAGLKRAANFLKIVSPRTSRNLLHYPDHAPIFHAFGIEDQLRTLHQRTVSLPSGGALVFDETEALVAVDVNSGKSRSARDAETNAFETNKEACVEICRQLKLRELGGLVILDLIDMIQSKNRKAIEKMFKDRFAKDKNRTTVLPISEFGIMELTRQRSQASHSSIHYTTSPDIKGRAMFRKPESLASEAIREVAAVASRDKVEKIELVVHPRVAGEMLSHRRRSISRLERRTGKSVDVRVSEQITHDRYVIYAYDENGNDIEVDRLPKIKPPKKLVPWAEIAESLGESYDWADEPDDAKTDPDAEMDEQLEKELEEASHPIEQGETEDTDEDEGRKKKRRRRRKRRRKSGEDGEASGETASQDSGEESEEAGEPSDDEASTDTSDESADGSQSESGDEPSEGGKKKRRRRRRRRKSGEESSEESTDTSADADASGEPEASDSENEPESDGATKKKKRRRRGRGSRDKGDSSSESTPTATKSAEPTPEPKLVKKKRRTLYGGGRRKLSASEKASLGDD